MMASSTQKENEKETVCGCIVHLGAKVQPFIITKVITILCKYFLHCNENIPPVHQGGGQCGNLVQCNDRRWSSCDLV